MQCAACWHHVPGNGHARIAHHGCKPSALGADAILVITHSGPSIPSSPVVNKRIVPWEPGKPGALASGCVRSSCQASLWV